MTYYEKLVKHIDKSMKAHPRSTIVMDIGSFKVLAMGTDIKKVNRTIRKSKKATGISVVFKNPGKNAVWILPLHSHL